MIRISIFFLLFFSISALQSGWGQNNIDFTCFQRDSISWDLSVNSCPSIMVDSFQIYTRPSESQPFMIAHSSASASVRGFKNDILKSSSDVFIKYFIRCPQNITISSDTLSLTSMRTAIELDTVRVMANGNVSLSWKKIPVHGMTYVVKTIIDEKTHELSGHLSENSYTDTRPLAHHAITYYTVSAFNSSNSCEFTLPEPDSFYHTSLLKGELIKCAGEMEFEFEPFSYWEAGTDTRYLMIEKDGVLTDSMELQPDQNTFGYGPLENHADYQFYVRETSAAIKSQVAYSNPIEIYTDFYEPIKWIVIRDINIDENNTATLTWQTNDHHPVNPFVLHSDGATIDLMESSITVLQPGKIYQSTINDFPLQPKKYAIALKDSCGNEIISESKSPLLTNGQLTGGFGLNIEWTDIMDEEWQIYRYRIFYKTNSSFTELNSTDSDTRQFHHNFDENNPVDSLCYYIEAEGDLYFSDIDSTATTHIRSNTVCLYGETVISIPNAFHPNGNNEFKPIIAPATNLTSYAMTIFDRYGNVIFETHNINEGWQGDHTGESGFPDVYVVNIELKNNQGEQWQKSGTVLLLR